MSNGFVLKRLIPGYLHADTDSKGYAAFLEWANLDFVPDPLQRFVSVAPVRVCVVQYQMRMVQSFEAFAEQCEYYLDATSEYRCDFVLFPEIFTTQLLSLIRADNPAVAVRLLAEYTPRYLDLFTRLAVKYNVNIIGGSHFTEEGSALYNIAYLFRRNGTLGKQYKLHITPSERHWWGVKGGDRVEVFDTDRGKIAIQVCYDIEFPELTRIAVEQGAQIIFVPFCTDERYGYLPASKACAQVLGAASRTTSMWPSPASVGNPAQRRRPGRCITRSRASSRYRRHPLQLRRHRRGVRRPTSRRWSFSRTSIWSCSNATANQARC